MISIIVPIYKAESHLRRCLDSITGQTFNDLQIILVNDGSPDNSGSICNEYARKDNRIIVIHQENSGVSAARNAGLEAATGKWIGFVDADDWIEADMYEYLLGIANANHADVVQCAASMECAEKRQILYSVPSDSEVRLSKESLRSYSANVWNKLYRKEIIEDCRFKREYSIGEDFLFNAEVLTRTNRVVFASIPKYHYIFLDDSSSHSVPTLKMLHSIRQTSLLAAKKVADKLELRDWFNAELIRNNQDICSKIVRFPRQEFEVLKREIRLAFRRDFVKAMLNKELYTKDKVKLFLIAWMWWVYGLLLLASKKMKFGSQDA